MNKELKTNTVNWQDGTLKITENFTVNDCLIQHAWGRLASSADGADFEKLTILCQKMEEIRKILQCPINVHCMFRCVEYNKSQNITPSLDVHAMNLACDFDAGEHWTIEEVKELLEPKLEELDIRLEKGTDTWIHVDLHSPGPSGRYFTP